MKIEIHNFGPIHHFEFDLDKDLHLIYGKNSVGKSYAVSVVYSILKDFLKGGWHFSSNGPYYQNQITYYPKTENSFTKFYDHIRTRYEHSNGFELNDYLSDYLKTFIQNSYLKQLENSLLKNFQTKNNFKNRFDDTNYSIFIKTNEFEMLIGSGKYRDFEVLNLEIKRLFQVSFQGDGIYINNEHFKNISKINLFQSETAQFSLTQELLVYFFQHTFQQIQGYIDKIYFLPASRSGLHQTLKTIKILNESEQDNVIKKLDLTEPIEDYFLNILRMNDGDYDITLSSIVDDIEKNLLEGIIKYDEKKEQIEIYKDKQSLILDLAQASSMQLELSSLLIYLKYIIQPRRSVEYKSVLFIEEPEAHVHPEVQVKLMEFFAEMTKHNIKVVMTTHSNYMLNKLNNMILDDKIPHNKVASYHLVMTEKGSVDAGDMQATELGIEDNNFVDIAEQLYDERLEIIEKLNKKQKEKLEPNYEAH